MKDYAYLVRKKIRRDKLVRDWLPFIYAMLAFSLFVLGLFLGSLLEEWEMYYLIAS